MSEAASLRWNQQKITKKFLNSHFGHKATVSEKDLLVETKGCVDYEKHSFKDEEGKEVTAWCRSLPILLDFYVKKLDPDV